MRTFSRQSHRFSCDSRRGLACLAFLAGCLLTRAAVAQQVSRPLHDALQNTGVGRGSPLRWREDDPDLVRAGVHATPEETFAADTAHRDETVIDLNEDGVAERIFTVTPSQDFTPRNPNPGLVMLQREQGGWRARVVFRLGSDSYPVESAGWDVIRERGRPVLALWLVLEGMEENDSGHGHHTIDIGFAVQVLLSGDALHAGTQCHEWSGSPEAMTPVRRCDGRPYGHATEDCAVCDALQVGSFVPCDRSIEMRSVPTPRWCRALPIGNGGRRLDAPLFEELTPLR